MGNEIKTIKFYKNYFFDFVDALPIKAAKKIYWSIDILRNIRHVGEPHLKSLEDTGGLFEIRTIFGGNIFRVFCFFDEGNVIVITSGFQKKSQKTPIREIERAQRIRSEYYEEKQKSKNS
jgi:phage-related protein